MNTNPFLTDDGDEFVDADATYRATMEWVADRAAILGVTVDADDAIARRVSADDFLKEALSKAVVRRLH